MLLICQDCLRMAVGCEPCMLTALMKGVPQ